MKFAVYTGLLAFSLNFHTAQGFSKPSQQPLLIEYAASDASGQQKPSTIFLGSQSLIGPIFDARGRAWLGNLDHWGTDGEVALQLDAIGKNFDTRTVCLQGASPIFWDKQNRLWMTNDNPSMLKGYDISKKQWVRRQSLTPEIREHLAFKQFSGDIQFRASGFQNRRGDLFFTDTWGVHVLSGKQWSYQMTFERLFERSRNGQEMSYYAINTLPHFAEDKAGRVYLWMEDWDDSSENTKGFWVWERGVWRHIEYVAHVLAVSPRADGAWVFSREGEALLWQKGNWLNRGSARQLLHDPLIWEKSEFRHILADGTLLFLAKDAVSRRADALAGESRERPAGRTTVLALPPRGPVLNLGEKLAYRLRFTSASSNPIVSDFGAKLFNVRANGVWVFDAAHDAKKPDEHFYAADLASYAYVYPRGLSKTGHIFFGGAGELWEMELSKLPELNPSDSTLNTPKFPPWPD